MSEKSKPKYKNLNHIQSFSEQRYATVEWANQNGENDEWLRQQVEKLSYLSPPAVRKRGNLSETINQEQSYGYQLTEKNEAIFSNTRQHYLKIDFTDLNLIDDKTNISIESYEDEDGNIKYQAVVPNVITANEVDLSTAHRIDNAVNSYWYVGYDKNKPYVLRPEWVNDIKNGNIPSIVRAQTFEVSMKFEDSTVDKGLLESITLAIQNTGEITHSWSSPLYVQLWPTVQKFVKKTFWLNQKQKSVYEYIAISSLKPKSQATADEIKVGQYLENYKKYTKFSETTEKTNYRDKTGQYYKIDKNGTHYIEREYIVYPKTKIGKGLSINKPLAEGIFNPEETSPGWYSIVFDKPAKVEKGKKYAVVMFSPLSHPTHCPRIGGWGRNCKKTKYEHGDAFLSEDNGRTFMRYGKTDKALASNEYKFGRYAPQDFAFECKILHNETGRDTEGDYYLYLKPILTNPITDFHLSGTINGEIDGNPHKDTTNIDFEYSTNGRDWFGIEVGPPKIFEEGNYPNVLFIRAKFTTSDSSVTPFINDLYVYYNTDVAKQMYVRTNFYNPKLTPMLGANIWGRVYAPYELKPENAEVNASVEIIQESVSKEHFHIVTVNELDEYLSVQDADGNFILDEDEIVGEDIDADDIAQYLIDNPSVLKALKESNSKVYVKPYVLEDKEYLMSFDDGEDDEGNPILGGLSLSNSPAYPIHECKTVSDTDEPTVAYGEWFDYNVDYDNDIIYFDKDVIDEMPVGGLYVKYNPVFIQNLSSDEVGRREDYETGLIEEGLILDYFKEQFDIVTENVEKRSVSLRCVPVDPIREVILNKDADNETELYEDVDFTVDYVNKQLVFPVVDDINQTSILKLGDKLDVVYTPNIEDTGIAIGYYVKRNNTDHQCKIKQNYIEYKVG